ncbi:MAG: DUF4981 domain-containing protein [Ileibacterium sp.]|nr:DUF4981 domain-containing protein [Ileibacterium sp.]
MKTDNSSMDWLTKPEIYKVNRLDPVSSLQYTIPERKARQSLNGAWLVSCSANLTEAPDSFFEKGFDDSFFQPVQVPGHLQLQGFGNLTQAHSLSEWDERENLEYGQVPVRNNLTACYVKNFELDEKLEKDFVKLVFHGVESAFYVWLNGTFIGYSEDSFTPSAFDVTDVLQPGQNRLCVQVQQFSSGSWLEDQDFFQFSGIFRDVELQSFGKWRLEDLKISTRLKDDYKNARVLIDMKLAREDGSCLVRFKDKEGNLLLGFETKKSLVALDLNEIRLWSAEDPYLYTLEIDVLDPDLKTCQSVTQKVGLRQFVLDQGIMKLNGQRIVFKGINRREFNKDRGRALTIEDMLYDIQFLKLHNINAVRTSQYPNQELWYDLCDEFGIYVMDEVNLETQGTWNFSRKDGCLDPLPGDRRLWKDAVLDRANSVYQRDKNHPCVLIWSLASDSGVGNILVEEAGFFRHNDPERLIHYEGCWKTPHFSDCTDMISRKYLSAQECEELLQTDLRKPMILCEYAPSLGNSNGGMDKFMELERFKKYQGGFLWEFIDQQLDLDLQLDGAGNSVPAFKDAASDGHLKGSGLLFANRIPSPKVQEVKYLYQNFTVVPDKFGVRIRNDSLFTPLSKFEVRYTQHIENKIIQSGTVEGEVLPGQEKKLFINWVNPEKESVKTVSIHLKEDEPWAKAGHEIAFGQSVQGSFSKMETRKSKMEIAQGDGCIGFFDKGFTAVFTERGLEALQYDNQDVLDGIPRPVFAHAFTDNERGFNFDQEASQWYGASLFSKVRKMEKIINKKDRCAMITYYYDVPVNPKAECRVDYFIAAPGLIGVDVTLEGQSILPRLPQLGMQIPLKKKLDKFVYYGLGPMENYADRQCGAKLGVFWQDVQMNLTPYLRPQECGSRCGVRWLEVVEKPQKGVRFSMLNHPLQISVLPNSFEELQQAECRSDLPSAKKTYAVVSGYQMGVGGENNWGKPVLGEYMLQGRKLWKFSFIISRPAKDLI